MLAKIKGALTRKLGPLPAWGWLGIVAGGVLVWRHFHPAPQTGQTTTPQDVPYSDSAPSSGGLGTGTGGLPGGGSEGSGGSGDAGTPPPEPLQPYAPGSPGGYADYGAADQGYGFGSPDSNIGPTSSTVPRNQGATTASQTTATLANGSVLRYNPVTGVVTEQAPGKTPYRVASGVTDFTAYVTKVKAKATSSTSKGKKIVAAAKAKVAKRPQAKADKASPTSGRGQTTKASAASSKRSTSTRGTPTRAKTPAKTAAKPIARRNTSGAKPTTAAQRAKTATAAHTHVTSRTPNRRPVAVHRRPPVRHR